MSRPTPALMVDALVWVDAAMSDPRKEALEYLVDMALGHDYADDAKVDDAQWVIEQALADDECATCSGRGVWMDEPCGDCAEATA